MPNSFGRLLTLALLPLLPLAGCVHPPASGEGQGSSITFRNQSGEEALVKLIGPASHTVGIPSGESETVRLDAGAYYLMVRYRDSSGKDTYSKGEPFEVGGSGRGRSPSLIFLDKLLDGKFQTHFIPREEFEGLPPAAKGSVGTETQPPPSAPSKAPEVIVKGRLTNLKESRHFLTKDSRLQLAPFPSVSVLLHDNSVLSIKSELPGCGLPTNGTFEIRAKELAEGHYAIAVQFVASRPVLDGTASPILVGAKGGKAARVRVPAGTGGPLLVDVGDVAIRAPKAVPAEAGASAPQDVTITATIVNMAEALKLVDKDSYIQLVSLPPDGRMRGKVDDQGRMSLDSDLARIAIPADGKVRLKCRALLPGKYILAIQKCSGVSGILGCADKPGLPAVVNVVGGKRASREIALGEVRAMRH